MYEYIINQILTMALRHKSVSEAKYQGKSYINAQNNNGYIQFIIEDNPYAQLLRSLPHQPLTLTVNIDVLAFPKKDYTVLNAQSDTAQVCYDVIAYLERQHDKYMTPYDYSLLGLSDFTDDNAAGQRLTLEMIMPKPIDFCSLADNFDEEEPTVEEKDITVKGEEDRSDQDITVRPTFIL